MKQHIVRFTRVVGVAAVFTLVAGMPSANATAYANTTAITDGVWRYRSITMTDYGFPDWCPGSNDITMNVTFWMKASISGVTFDTITVQNLESGQRFGGTPKWNAAMVRAAGGSSVNWDYGVRKDIVDTVNYRYIKPYVPFASGVSTHRLEIFVPAGGTGCSAYFWVNVKKA